MAFGWLPDEDLLEVLDDASTAVVRERVRAVAARLGFDATRAEHAVLIASELARNQLAHAAGGDVAVRATARDGVAGIEIVAADRGSGLAAPRSSFAGAPRSRGSLGVGLASVRSLADEVDVDARIDEGTVIAARVFAVEVPRHRELGVFGRPYPGEPASGDHAAWARIADGRLFVVVADGLGHGRAAREAADRAVTAAVARSSEPAEDLLGAVHEALRGTRGAVLTAAWIDDVAGWIEVVAAGNVTLEVAGPRASRRAGAASFVLGTPGRVPRRAPERLAVDRRDVVLVSTDGLRAGDAWPDRTVLLEHPVAVAEALVRGHARDGDDVLVVAAR